MRKEIKDLWVKALRSGEFKQIKGRLDNGYGYCALGVLAALALTESQCTYDKGGRYDGKRLGLSYSIMKWAGIAQLDDDFLNPGAGLLHPISKMNDEGKSFKQIADYIEKHWREL